MTTGTHPLFPPIPVHARQATTPLSGLWGYLSGVHAEPTFQEFPDELFYHLEDLTESRCPDHETLEEAVCF